MKLKKMKVKQRITLAVCGVTVLASCTGVVSSLMMRNIQKAYDVGMVRFGFAQGDTGMVMGEFAKLDGKVHDAISCLDANIRQKSQSEM